MPQTNRNHSAGDVTIQEEMAIRTRQFSYRVANAGIVSINAAYVGDPWITRLFNILQPISGRFLTNPLDVITPNMICMRFNDYNAVIITGISTASQGLDLAAGGALIKPLFNIPGNVFGAIWDVSDAPIQYMRECFGGDWTNQRWAFYGHSMGGGLTSHSIARLIKQFSVPNENIICNYTFGSPKPGDPEFCNWLSEQCPCFTLQAPGDPVPLLPPVGSQMIYNVTTGLSGGHGAGSARLTFNYAHPAQVWSINPDGTLETTDNVSSAIQGTRATFQSLVGSVTGFYDDALARHNPYNYQNSLNAASGDWRNSIALINLGGSIQENVPDTIEAPAAPPYPLPPYSFMPNNPAPATPTIRHFNPNLFDPNLNWTGTPGTSRITGSVTITPIVNRFEQPGLSLRAVDLTVKDRNFEEGYDRRLLETTLSAIKNMRKQDSKKMMRGNSTNVIFPNDDIAYDLAIVNHHIEELLDLRGKE